MKQFLTLEDLDVKGKTVLVRMDLNVPMQGGKVTDTTRITRQLPTVLDLTQRGAKVVIMSHLARPKGKFVPSMSLSPLVDALSEAMNGKPVQFGVDCVGPAAQEAVGKLQNGDVLLLENLRFHAQEEANDAAFAKELAKLGEVFVNDAFSCSHRAHASVVGLNNLMPSAAGRLMQEELETLDAIFTRPDKPLAAVVGGSKVSTKLELLDNLSAKVDMLLIGGAMANTFLYAKGHKVGASLCETDLKKTALDILKHAESNGCKILLPTDVVVADALQAQQPCEIVGVDAIPNGSMALDIGPETLALYTSTLASCKTVVWNGPVGAFEISPFDVGTISLARTVAGLTRQGKLRSIAGGGDTVAALTHAGLASRFSYLSTAGGAFLEWMEGKPLPGVAALQQAA